MNSKMAQSVLGKASLMSRRKEAKKKFLWFFWKQRDFWRERQELARTFDAALAHSVLNGGC